LENEILKDYDCAALNTGSEYRQPDYKEHIMSKQLLFTVSDSTSLAELYRRLSHGIDIIEQHIGYAHKRALPTVKQAIDHMRRFVSGELGTDEGAKLWFKKLTKLAEEVGDMTAAQSAYILAAAEVAHWLPIVPL